jgi:DNA-binding transcriptional regulator YiaG
VKKRTTAARRRGPSLATALQADFREIAARATRALHRRVVRLQKQARGLRRTSLDQRRGLARLERGIVRMREIDAGSMRRAGAGGPAVKPTEVRALRSRLGMTRERFARHLGVSPGSIFLWETGRARPRAGSAARLRKAGGARPNTKRRRGARGR